MPRRSKTSSIILPIGRSIYAMLISVDVILHDIVKRGFL